MTSPNSFRNWNCRAPGDAGKCGLGGQETQSLDYKCARFSKIREKIITFTNSTSGWPKESYIGQRYSEGIFAIAALYFSKCFSRLVKSHALSSHWGPQCKYDPNPVGSDADFSLDEEASPQRNLEIYGSFEELFSVVKSPQTSDLVTIHWQDCFFEYEFGLDSAFSYSQETFLHFIMSVT